MGRPLVTSRLACAQLVTWARATGVVLPYPLTGSWLAETAVAAADSESRRPEVSVPRDVGRVLAAPRTVVFAVRIATAGTQEIVVILESAVPDRGRAGLVGLTLRGGVVEASVLPSDALVACLADRVGDLLGLDRRRPDVLLPEVEVARSTLEAVDSALRHQAGRSRDTQVESEFTAAGLPRVYRSLAEDRRGPIATGVLGAARYVSSTDTMGVPAVHSARSVSWREYRSAAVFAIEQRARPGREATVRLGPVTERAISGSVLELLSDLNASERASGSAVGAEARGAGRDTGHGGVMQWV